MRHRRSNICRHRNVETGWARGLFRARLPAPTPSPRFRLKTKARSAKGDKYIIKRQKRPGPRLARATPQHDPSGRSAANQSRRGRSRPAIFLSFCSAYEIEGQYGAPRSTKTIDGRPEVQTKVVSDDKVRSAGRKSLAGERNKVWDYGPPKFLLAKMSATANPARSGVFSQERIPPDPIRDWRQKPRLFSGGKPVFLEDQGSAKRPLRRSENRA